MKRLRIVITTAASAALMSAPVFAGVPAALDAAGSAFALPMVAMPVVSVPASQGGSYTAGHGGATTLEAIRHRPRRRHRDRDEDRWSERVRSSGYVQFHGGVFDPEDTGRNGGVFGMRVGGSLEDKAQVGVAIDWNHRSDRSSDIVRSEPLPGGGTVERRIDIASSSFDLVPVLAFLQVTPAGSNAGPYFGIGGGYEALFITAEDFETGSDYEATFDGWGWQAWGGFAFPLSREARFNAEVFANGGDLDRELEDSETGATVREVVDVTGGGVRLGLSWSF